MPLPKEALPVTTVVVFDLAPQTLPRSLNNLACRQEISACECFPEAMPKTTPAV